MLIVLDVDGTLLRDDLTLSPFAESTLKTLIKKGHKVVLASGRPPRSMLPYYEKLGLDTPLIAYNGALVYSPSDSSFPRREAKFQKEKVISIYKEAKGFLRTFMAESAHTIFDDRYDPYLDQYFPYMGMAEISGNITENISEDVYTCLFSSEHEFDKKLEEAVIRNSDYRLRHWRDSIYSELYIEGYDKGTALSYIQKKLGIGKEDTIAIGDSDNDLPMLYEAKYPFIMKNHKGAIKDVSFQKTSETNNEDGAIKAVLNILNNL